MKSDVYTTYESIIPSFYTEVFKEKDLMEKLLKGVDLVHMQVRKDTDRNAKFASVLEPDPLQTTVVETITLEKTERTAIAYGADYKYGDLFNGGSGYNYGDQANQARDVYDLGDDSIKSIGYVSDGIDSPTKIYTEGVDFYVDNGLIVFCKPLRTVGATEGLFPDLNTGSADFDDLPKNPDIELVAYNVRRDKKELSRQFGYVFGFDAPPTTNGRDVFTGMWKLHTFGPSWFWTMFTLARAFGTDVVRTKSETVLAKKQTSLYGTVVVTERNTYICDNGDTPDVGQTRDYGYPISNNVSVLHDLDAQFRDGVPGVTTLSDSTYGDVAVFGAVAPPDEGNPSGSLYLRPQGLIIIQVDGSLSDEETSKLIEIFEDVLPKNTRVVIILNVATKAENEDLNTRKKQGTDPASPGIIETAIMEGSTNYSRAANKSKLRLSTR